MGVAWARAWRHEYTWPFQRPVRCFAWLEVEWVGEQPEMIPSPDHSNLVCLAKEFGFYSKYDQKTNEC